jgi:hypothetical protein
MTFWRFSIALAILHSMPLASRQTTELGFKDAPMYESWSYRRDLFAFADDFRRRTSRQIWRESSIKKAEKMLFVGFYFVKKLIENRKVSDVCARSSAMIGRATLKRTREVSDFMRHDLEKDLHSVEFTDAKVDVSQLCDMIVHAWWSIPVQNESGGLAGFILTSDKRKNKELWSVPSHSIVDVFTRFGKSSISSLLKRSGMKMGSSFTGGQNDRRLDSLTHS